MEARVVHGLQPAGQDSAAQPAFNRIGWQRNSDAYVCAGAGPTLSSRRPITQAAPTSAHPRRWAAREPRTNDCAWSARHAKMSIVILCRVSDMLFGFFETHAHRSSTAGACHARGGCHPTFMLAASPQSARKTSMRCLFRHSTRPTPQRSTLRWFLRRGRGRSGHNRIERLMHRYGIRVITTPRPAEVALPTTANPPIPPAFSLSPPFSVHLQHVPLQSREGTAL